MNPPVFARIKRWLLNLAARIVFYSGTLRFINQWITPRSFHSGTHFFRGLPYIKRACGRIVQILMYHRVNDDYDPYFPATSTGPFAQQMNYLASHFNVLPLLDAVSRIQANDIPENCLVLTFDDGYRDNFIYAYPILKRLSLPATIFLATRSIGSQHALWHDLVFSAFRNTRVPCLSSIGNTPDVYPLRTTRERLYALRQVLEFLWTLDPSERMLSIDQLNQKLRVENFHPKVDLMLTWDDVSLMHANGISFGSHTVNHPILTKVSKEMADEEIRSSKTIIETHLGVPVKCFAYPNGRKEDFNGLIKELLKGAGYVCAVTTVFGANGYGSDMYELRRCGPPDFNLAEFAVRLHWYKRHVYPRT